MRRAGLILVFALLPLAPTTFGFNDRPSREERDRMKRHQKAVKRFRDRHPCPATFKTKGACPGWQIVYKVPPEAGGAALPSNMHWLSEEERRVLRTAHRNAN